MNWTALTEGDVRNILRDRVQRYGDEKVLQTDIAKEIGIQDSMLSEILHGKRKPTKRVVAWLGLERFVRYRRKK